MEINLSDTGSGCIPSYRPSPGLPGCRGRFQNGSAAPGHLPRPPLASLHSCLCSLSVSFTAACVTDSLTFELTSPNWKGLGIANGSICVTQVRGLGKKESLICWTPQPGRMRAIWGRQPWKEWDLSKGVLGAGLLGAKDCVKSIVSSNPCPYMWCDVKVVPNSLRSHTAVGSLSLLQRIFPNQESNQGLLHCRGIRLQCRRQRRPRLHLWVGKRGGNGNPLQYSCSENSTGRGAWWATVHGVAKSGTQLSTAQQRGPME